MIKLTDRAEIIRLADRANTIQLRDRAPKVVFKFRPFDFDFLLKANNGLGMQDNAGVDLTDNRA